MRFKSKIKNQKSKLQKIKFFFKLSIINRQSSIIQSGFTLIELMVVVAIIGLLTSIIFANFTGIQKRSRDGQRKTDLRSIQHALELYRSDQGYYPASLYVTPGNCSTSTFVSLTNGSSTYMQKVPCDPQALNSYWNSPSGNYFYAPLSSTGVSCDNSSLALYCVTYKLVACVENSNDLDPNDCPTPNSCPTGMPGSCSSGKYYVLVNP